MIRANESLTKSDFFECNVLSKNYRIKFDKKKM